MLPSHPYYIERKDWQFIHHPHSGDAPPLTLEAAVMQDSSAQSEAMDRLQQFLVKDLARGRRYSRKQLESVGDAVFRYLGVTSREKLRNLVDDAIASELLELRQDPSSAGKAGARQTYLHPIIQAKEAKY